MIIKKPGYNDRAFKHFTDATALTGGQRDITSLMGIAKCQVNFKKWPDALNLVNQAVVQHPKIIPCLLEKMAILLAMQDWEQANETAKRYMEDNYFERLIAVC